MKKLIYLILVFAFTGNAILAQIPTMGLIANYPLGISNSSGTTTVGAHNDISGNGYHLTFNNGFGYGDNRQLVSNEAAAFNGVSTDKRSFNYTSNITAFEQYGNFTISMWVRLGTPIANEYSSIVQIGNNDIFLRFRLTASGDFIQGGYRTGNTTFAVLSPSIVRSNFTNTWVHLLMRRTGGQLEIFVNNNQISTNTFTSNPSISNVKTFTVGNSGDPNTCMVGRMQDVLLYNRALTAQELTNVFEACNTIVNTTPFANLNVCQGTTTTLSVSGSSITWFNVPSGGSSVGSGNSFTTPTLSTATTFYAQVGNCQKRTAITVNVSSSTQPVPPTILSDTSIVFCEGTTTTISVQSADSVRWYNAPTGGNLLGSQKNFLTPILQNTAGQGQVGVITFYAEALKACGSPQTSSRTAVKVKVNGSFPISNNTPPDRLFVCSGNNVQLFATATGADTIKWTLDDNFVSNSNFLTVSALTQSRTYKFTAVKNGVCTQHLNFPIKIHNTFGTAPTNTSGPLPTGLCQNETVNLSASTTHNAPLYWYTTPTGGTSYAIGDTALTVVAVPYNSTSVNYYVQSGKDNCASPRTAIPVSATFAPVGTISLSGTTITSNNLYETYVLKKDGQIVAQSNTTGTFTFNNATCGNYQAFFTNTVNSTCANGVTLKVSKNPTMYSDNCYTFYLTSPGSGPGTIQASVAGGPFGFTSYYDGNQVGFLTNVCGITTNTNVAFRFIYANGCTFQYANSFNNIPSSNQNTHSNVASVTAMRVGFDTLTNCTIRSNTISVGITAPTSTTLNSNRFRCFGQTTTLTVSGSGTLSWYNQPTGGTVLGTGTSFTTPAITANTTFYVESTSGNCVSPRTAISVSLNAQPFISIDRTIDTMICQGETVFLNTQTNNPINPSWNPPLGPSNQVSPLITTTYTYTVSNVQGCIDSSKITIFVNAKTANSYTQSVCFGGSTTFKGQTITLSGTYRDTLVNAVGCDSIVTLNFTVKNRAAQTINAGICSGQSYTFKGRSLTQAGQYFDTLQTTLGCDSFITLNLAVNSFVTGSATASICQGQSYSFNGQQLTQGGQYLDTLTSVGGCDSILTLTLSVNILPQPTIIQNGNILSTQTFNSYLWKLNNVNINTATNQSHTATQNGSYTVLVSNANGCNATSQSVNVNGVSIDEAYFLNVSIYPSPASDYITVETKELINSIIIYDLSGKQVKNLSNLKSLNEMVDVSTLPTATYHLQIITTEGKTINRNFVKK
jgi:hypothetical protein